MAMLQCANSGRKVHLEPNYLIGRSEHCLLRLDDPHVSNEHASIRWDGMLWILKDLGSLNRTYLDDAELKASTSTPIRIGSRISFGTVRQTWQLADDGGPVPMAVPEDGSEPILASDGLLPLPSAENPQYTVYRHESGAWVVDVEDGVRPVEDRSIIQLGLRRYRFSLPQPYARTTPLNGFIGSRAPDMSLEFRVSSDMETIELEACVAHSRHQFSARTHNEMLLLLARTRLDDIAAGLPTSSCGWLYQDDLCRKLGVDAERLNVDVYRVRRQFADLGLLDPAQVIERRSKTRQIRIGTAKLSERPL
jgi:hypothetical protein